jgi:hypothetical protein
MNLGTEKKFEAWVLHYGMWKRYSEGHSNADDAFRFARKGGWDADKIEVVMSVLERTRVASKEIGK